MKALSRHSPWTAEQVESFLGEFRAPIRLAARTPSDFPMLCSLWFAYRDGALYCATQRGARIVESLQADPRVAFEISPNEPPYYGVRGRGLATASPEGASQALDELIDRYLGEGDAGLARWLRSRVADEVVLTIQPEWLTSWDFRDRMAAPSPD